MLEILEKPISFTLSLTSSHYLAFSEEISGNINGGDFFMVYNEICQ